MLGEDMEEKPRRDADQRGYAAEKQNKGKCGPGRARISQTAEGRMTAISKTGNEDSTEFVF
jgi:hypothetical protein